MITIVIESDHVICIQYAIWLVLSSTYHFLTDKSLQSVDKDQQESCAVAEKPCIWCGYRIRYVSNLQWHHAVLSCLCLLCHRTAWNSRQWCNTGSWSAAGMCCCWWFWWRWTSIWLVTAWAPSIYFYSQRAASVSALHESLPSTPRSLADTRGRASSRQVCTIFPHVSKVTSY